MRSNKVSRVIRYLILFLLWDGNATYAQRPERPVKRPPSQIEGPSVQIERIVPWPQQGDIKLTIWANKGCGSTYYMGEYIDISFTVDRDSYVTIYDIDVTGHVTILFPNQYYKENLVRSGRVYTIPNKYSGYQLTIEGPSGLELLEGITSTDGYHHWFFDGVSTPPIWSNEWGSPTTWGGKYTREPGPWPTGPNEDPPNVSKQFEKRLQYQGPRDPNQIANYIRDQIRNLSRTRIQPGYQWGSSSCAFYVIHYLGYSEHDSGGGLSSYSYSSQPPYEAQGYPPTFSQPQPAQPSYPAQPYPSRPHPASPSQPSPPSPSYGILSISSFPEEAHVFLNGNYEGMAPLTLNQVPIGTHQLRIEKEGYDPYEKTIQIKRGSPTKIDAYLKQIPVIQREEPKE